MAAAVQALDAIVAFDYILDCDNTYNTDAVSDGGTVINWDNPGTYIDTWWNDGGTFPTRKPVWNESDADFGGASSMTFDGSDNWLAVFHNNGDPAPPYHVFIVFKPATINANERVLSTLASLSANRPELLYADGTHTNWLANAGTTFTGPAIGDNTVVGYCIDTTNNAAKWWVNDDPYGSPTATGDTDAKTIGSGLLLGTDWNGGATETTAFKIAWLGVTATTPASVSESAYNAWQDLLAAFGVV